MIALYSRTKCKYLCNKQGLESKAKSRARTGTVQPPLFRPQCAHAHAEIGLVSLTHRHHVNDEKSGIHSLCAGPTMVQTDCCLVLLVATKRNDKPGQLSRSRASAPGKDPCPALFVLLLPLVLLREASCCWVVFLLTNNKSSCVKIGAINEVSETRRERRQEALQGCGFWT